MTRVNQQDNIRGRQQKRVPKLLCRDLVARLYLHRFEHTWLSKSGRWRC